MFCLCTSLHTRGARPGAGAQRCCCNARWQFQSPPNLGVTAWPRARATPSPPDHWHLPPGAKAAVSQCWLGPFLWGTEGCGQPGALLSHPRHPRHPQQDLPVPSPWGLSPSQSHRRAELGGSSSPGLPRGVLGGVPSASSIAGERALEGVRAA